ncbi:hypothetical protein BDFB_012448 [Asbolus verrucosus]|uniref:Uncharacterized protein n=1 Tax=Asbolus verrucosus TaxID=1661398 RepID=A0A482VFZ4_ASBVE|nr:hypothetical protein BDFB_012448 [Asbolus verrucosus]
MQQQQLAAQLAHHGSGTRQPPLSPTPSDSDSDISLGAHSPPISSPGPIRFGASSPTPITSFRFGPHSPGPMPAQFRFGDHTPPNFRLDRQSPNFRLDRKLRNSESPINVDTATSNYNSAVNLRLTSNESPIDVDSNNDYRQEKSSSPIRVDNSPSQTSPPPPMNLRVADHLRMAPEGAKIEAPLPLRLTAPPLTTPLRIQVASPNRMAAPPSPHTNLHLGGAPHGGIVRIAPPSPSNPSVLHRPFSPPRLT